MLMLLATIGASAKRRPTRNVLSPASEGTSNCFKISSTALRFSSELAVTIDRKSTRLNSSHVAISYAVFCLKKNKNYGMTLNICAERDIPALRCLLYRHQ